MEKYKLFIDEKVSVWRRTYVMVEADTLDEAIQKCKEEDYEIDYSEYLSWTEELEDPEEYATYEIYKENGNSDTTPIYSNYDRQL